MKPVLCIVGLGYVGLPLAHAFSKKGYEVYGFDVSEKRVQLLQEGVDWTNELSKEELAKGSVQFSTDASVIGKADIVMMALPTPVDAQNKPDLKILKDATRTVGKNMKRGAIVCYESTVYPGVTEEICGKILEEESGMTSGTDFTLGYSPERINPGDKLHTVETIIKVVGGQDEKTTDALVELYSSIVAVGIHRAPNIKVAEMAKAIENAQRDINIAYMNEIALLCNRIGISTKDVLDAAGTKWNFLRFTPGLVGGHCIGVDPYYLVEKAKELGLTTHIISAGRQINDAMPGEIADQIHNALKGSSKKILVLGLTFKENVPDTRNSKSIDVITALEAKGHTVTKHDPYAAPGSIDGTYDAVVLLVPHREYFADLEKMIETTAPGGLIYDLKSVLNRSRIETSGRTYLSL